MRRRLNRLYSFIFAIIILLTSLNVDVSAVEKSVVYSGDSENVADAVDEIESLETADVIEEVQDDELGYEICINPYYAEVIGEDILRQQIIDITEEYLSQESVEADGALSIFTNDTDAARYLREQMVLRKTAISFLTNISKSCDEIYNMAIEHTESTSGQEGDALRESYNSHAYLETSDEVRGVVYRKFTYTFSFFTTYEQEQELTEKVNKVMQELNLDGLSEYNKIRKIHDYICDNVDYDYYHYNNNRNYMLMYTAYAALCKGTSVCEGYAVLFYRMCKEAGIPVRHIVGKGGGELHAWNIVKMDRFYYNIDTTWDGQDAITNHNYFLQCDNDFINHTRNADYKTDEFYAKYPMSDKCYVDKELLGGYETDMPNLEYTYTGLDGTDVTTKAGYNNKIIIYYNFKEDATLFKNLKSIDFSDVDVIAIGTNSASSWTNLNKSQTVGFRNANSNSEITFAYESSTASSDKVTTHAYRYLCAVDSEAESYTFPVLIYVDASNHIKYLHYGRITSHGVEYLMENVFPAIEPEPHEVSFDMNYGGSGIVETRTYINGQRYEEFPSVTRNGYTFDGWYTAATDGEKITETMKIVLDGDTTYYAHWTPAQYTVSFNANGGSVTPLSQVVTFDETYGDLPVPTRKGYTFTGWYTAATDGDEINKYSTVAITSAITLYAHWNKTPIIVNFDANDGYVTPGNKTVYYGDPYGEIPTPTRPGYKFEGWYTEKAGGIVVKAGTKVASDENHIIYAHWSGNYYTVTFDANYEGSTPSQRSYQNGTTYGIIQDPSRQGYTFEGWYTQIAGGNKIEPTTVVNLTDDSVVYAHWSPIGYRVSFEANGGSGTMTPKDVFYGDPYGELPIPTKAGVLFAGWYTRLTGGTLVDRYTIVDITSNITLYAHWAGAQYTVSFDANGGSVSTTSKTVFADNSYGRLPVPVQTGHDFLGWYTDRENGDLITEDTIVNIDSNIALYAHWKNSEYTITFNANGGSVKPSTKKVTFLDTYGELPTPTRPGYDFLGWYTDKTGTVKIIESTTVDITSDRILYAHWNPCSYEVTFNAMGGECAITTIEVTNEQKYGDLPEVTRTGYDFAGWYTEETGGVQIKSSTIVMLTMDQELFARWNPKAFKVSFNLNYDNATKAPADKTVYYDAAYGSMPSVDRDGHDFDGWFTLPEGGNKVTGATIVRLDGDETLYAHWTVKSYTVSFKTNGGSLQGEESSKRVTYGMTYGELPTPTRDSYTFDGWYTNVTSGTLITSTSIVDIIADQNLYAHWLGAPCTVTFDANGGTVGVESTTVYYEGTYGDLPTPTRTGYSFRGWYTQQSGGEYVGTTSTVNTQGDHTLYAAWQGNTYKVYFSRNDGSGKGTNKDYTNGEPFGTLSTITRQGYTFGGWWTDPIDGERITALTEVFLTKNTTMYAHWIPEKHMVSFNPNGGIVDVDCKEVTNGQKYGELPVPLKAGYGFDGWYTAVVAGDKIDSNTIVDQTGDIVLYAHWKSDAYTVTFDANGGTCTPASKTVYNDEDYGTLPTPIYPGYDFAGWFTALEGGEQIFARTKVSLTRDITVYARYTCKKLRVSFNATGGIVDVENKMVVYNSPYGTLPKPYKEGSKFIGWSTSLDEEHIVTDGTLVSATDNHTLYAHWTKNRFTITFDGNGGESDLNSKTVVYGDTYGMLPSATRAGFDFAGWFTSDVSGHEIKSSTVVKLTYNQELFAHWKAKEYSVSFDSNGGEITEGASSKTILYRGEYGELPVAVKTGKNFNGWYTAPIGGTRILDTTQVKILGSHTLYAQWVGSTYKVKLVLNGGICDKEYIEAAYEGVYGKLPLPSKPKCDFAGWFLDEDFLHEITSESVVTIDAQHELYAKWVNKYTAEVPTANPLSGNEITKNTRVELNAQQGAKIIYTFDPAIGMALNAENGELYTDVIRISDVITGEMVPGSTVTVWVKAIKEDYNDSPVNAVVYTVKDESEEWGDVTDSDRVEKHFINANDIPEDMWVAGVPENVDYKGSAYVFENLHVYNHKSLLKQGEDYTVKYTGNTNAGVATVTITGTGNYDKVITLRFNINKLPLGNLGVNDSNTIATDITLVANGKVQKGTTPVMYNLNGKYITLKKNKDYRFIYEDIYDYTAPDEYIVKIEGLGNYSGCGSFTEKIVSVGNMTPVSKLKFGKIADKSATGDPVYAEDLVIRDASRNVLIKDVDYTLEYINNVLPGTATVIVKGVELKGYSGTKVLSYKIKAIPISKAKISAISACPYTKEECRPQFSVDYTPNKKAVTETLKEYVAGIGGDYSYEYVNNVKAGKNKAYIKVTGHGRFSGTLKKYFTITARDISDLECSNLQDEYEYVKGGVKPSFSIMDGDYVLAAGKDYSVSYKNNKAVAFKTGKKAPSVTIKGKGNYKGTLLHTFDITVSSIDKGHIVVGDIVASNMAGTCKPVFTVYDKDNSKLKSGTDFEKSYELQYAQETYINRVTDSKRNISESILVSDGDVVDVKKDIIPVGTDIRLIVTGKGKYAGTKKQVSTLSAEFTYVEADISKATVTVKEQDYIGQDIPVELSKGDIDITLKINGRIVRLDKDCYEIVKSTYVGNTKSGTAKVTIRGKRGTNYWCGGTKTISFKIKKRNLRDYFSN